MSLWHGYGGGFPSCARWNPGPSVLLSVQLTWSWGWHLVFSSSCCHSSRTPGGPVSWHHVKCTHRHVSAANYTWHVWCCLRTWYFIPVKLIGKNMTRIISKLMIGGKVENSLISFTEKLSYNQFNDQTLNLKYSWCVRLTIFFNLTTMRELFF